MSTLLAVALTTGGAFIGVVLTTIFQAINARSQRHQEMILKTYETRIEVYLNVMNILCSIRDIQSTQRSDLKEINELHQRLDELINRRQWALSLAETSGGAKTSASELPEQPETIKARLDELNEAKTFLEGYGSAFSSIQESIAAHTISARKRQVKVTELARRVDDHMPLIDLVGSTKARAVVEAIVAKMGKGEQVSTKDIDCFIAIARSDIGISR